MFAGFTNAGVKGVCGIELFVEFFLHRLGLIHVADIVFGGIFCPLCIETLKHLSFDCLYVGSLLEDIVLMKDVAHEMTIVEC